MKRLILLFTALVALIYLSGCSEKFNIAAPYKNITVVYGFLDNNDTAHYIRIQKAFLDQNKSALDMAKDFDSSFYKHLNVMIERRTYNNKLQDTIHLDIVNLDNEGYPKQAGTFFNTPNYAYKFKGLLDVTYIYRLKITELNTGKVDSSDAPIIDSDPTWFRCDFFDPPPPKLDFNSTAGYKTVNFSGNYIAPLNFSFEGLSTPVTIAQAIFRFNYVDSNMITGVQTPHSFDFDAGFITVNNSNFEYNVHNTDFYSALSSGIPEAPANTARLLDRCDLFVYMSTQDFATYRERSRAQGTGLTGSEIQPIYTNIKGDNALGIFTSRGMRTGKLTLTEATVDSLKISSYLSRANIKGTVYH